MLDTPVIYILHSSQVSIFSGEVQGHPIDDRVDSQREKIIFNLTKGAGSFASVYTADQKQSGSITVTVNFDDAAEVLFFPSSATDESQYLVEASVAPGAVVSGNLSFNFETKKLVQKDFDDVCEKIDQVGGKIRAVKQKDEMTTIRSQFDRTGTSQGSQTTEKTVMLQNADGSAELHNNDENGKLIFAKKATSHNTEKRFCERTVPWGETGNDCVFKSEFELKDAGGDLITFFFVNKEHGVVDKVLSVNDKQVTEDDRSYDFSTDTPTLQHGVRTEKYIWGSSQSVDDVVHLISR